MLTDAHTKPNRTSARLPHAHNRIDRYPSLVTTRPPQKLTKQAADRQRTYLNELEQVLEYVLSHQSTSSRTRVLEYHGVRLCCGTYYNITLLQNFNNCLASQSSQLASQLARVLPEHNIHTRVLGVPVHSLLHSKSSTSVSVRVGYYSAAAVCRPIIERRIMPIAKIRLLKTKL